MHSEYGLVTLALTFAPTCIALLRGHKSIAAIVVINVLMIICVVSIVGIGIGVFLWFVGIIWAFTGNTRGNDKRIAQLMAEHIREPS
jgi:hypothetical protein